MEDFRKDIEGIFQNCESDLSFYIFEYDLDIQEMKKAFCKYVEKWFDRIEKAKKNLKKKKFKKSIDKLNKLWYNKDIERER